MSGSIWQYLHKLPINLSIWGLNTATRVLSLRVWSSLYSLTENVTQVEDDPSCRNTRCSPVPQVESDIRHLIVWMLAAEEDSVKDGEGEVWLGWRTEDNLDQETLGQFCKHSAVVQALLHVLF